VAQTSVCGSLAEISFAQEVDAKENWIKKYLSGWEGWLAPAPQSTDC